MKPKLNKFNVSYTQDETGHWVAEVKELPGCLTQGRTVRQARERIREAIQAFIDLPAPFAGELGMEICVSVPTRRALKAYQAATEKAIRAAEAETMLREKLMKSLKKEGVGNTDVGELLGVSRQRAHVLSQLADRRAAPPAAAPRAAAKARPRRSGKADSRISAPPSRSN
jgi:predicted RNase H-like HicB family nuclease